MTFDRSKAEAFSEEVMAMLNHGALTLMISLGHRAGLFDYLDGREPTTSQEIAEALGLSERYVREWLGAMVTGGIVEVDDEAPRYWLPAEHAAFLTRQAAPDNMASFAQYIPLLGGLEEEILERFEAGGGVPYDRYGRFHEIMAEDSGQSVLPALLDQILPLAPDLPERLDRGADVLDIGCGAGRALMLMAEAYPRSRFTGYDLSEEVVAKATEAARRRELENLRFEQRDLTGFTPERRYDLVTAFDAIHDQKDPSSVLAGVSEALRPGGVFLMQDINSSSRVQENRTHPAGPLLYTLSCLHCMPVSLAQGGAGLGAMWGRQLALQLLEEAGFTEVEVHELKHDFQNIYYVARRR